MIYKVLRVKFYSFNLHEINVEHEKQNNLKHFLYSVSLTVHLAGEVSTLFTKVGMNTRKAVIYQL